MGVGLVGDKLQIKWLAAIMVNGQQNAIDAALDDYLAEHEDNDIWYSFHEFIEDREG